MHSRVSLIFVLLILVVPQQGISQPGPLGCSIVPDDWEEVQVGLDRIFFGACFDHDRCYRVCNPINGPYVGLGYKVGCDTAFAADMAISCEVYTLILSFPNVKWVDASEFLDECLDYAEAAYGLVLSAGTYAFLNGQCSFYCNRAACEYLNRPWTETEQGFCESICREPVDPCIDRPWDPNCAMCPIGLDLQGNGFKLTGPNPPVYFDLDADGTPDHTSWTRMQTKDGFLVLDRNRNGRIDDGRELFGTAAPLLLSAAPVLHGYQVLEEFDRTELGGNEDGVIDPADRIFEHLQVWLDLDRDAVTDPGELRSLVEAGVSSISLSYYQDDQADQWGNVLRWWSPITLDDGTESLSVDVFFERLPE